MKKKIIITISIVYASVLFASIFSPAEAFFNKKLKNRIADLEQEVKMLTEARELKAEQITQEIKKNQNALNDANKKIEALQAKLKGAEKKLDGYKKAEEKNKKQLDKYAALQKKYDEVKVRADELEKKCIILRNMSNGEQREIKIDTFIEEVKKVLKKC